MFSSDLNNDYTYETERRNDERRAAAESQRTCELDEKHKFKLFSLLNMLGILIIIIVVTRAV
ncbi:MAG: hypothetical protein ABI986_09255 [Chloroflexota bacterium]